MHPANGQLANAASPLRVGVYVCHCGGNISDVVDVNKLTQAASSLPDVAVARPYTFMCSDPGQQMIIDDIVREGLNRIVVAACSPSLHELTFRQTLVRAGLNPFLYEHVNIREQVSWVTKSDPKGATAKAARLIAVGGGEGSLEPAARTHPGAGHSASGGHRRRSKRLALRPRSVPERNCRSPAGMLTFSRWASSSTAPPLSHAD